MTNAYKPGAGFTLRSHYGERTDPINGKEGEFHSGQDFAAKAGTPIPSALSISGPADCRRGARICV